MSERGVAAIIMVIVAVTLLITLAGGLVLLTSTGYKSYHFSKDLSQALYLAEAGISSAIREIRDNEDHDEDGGVGSIAETTLTYSDSSSAGSYSCVSSGDSTCILTSTGTVNEISRTITAIYLSGLEFSDAVSYRTNLDYNSEKVDIIGGVDQVDELPVPDMEFFYDNADYYVVREEQILTGVYYVTGNVELERGVTLKGSLIVKDGTLTIDRNCTINPSLNPDETKQDYPAVVVAGDNAQLTIARDCTISGLVYCSGDVLLDRGNVIMGTLAGDSITIEREVTIMLEDSISVPGFQGAGLPKISLVPGSWQELSQ